jgi:hypothetical protein
MSGKKVWTVRCTEEGEFMMTSPDGVVQFMSFLEWFKLMWELVKNGEEIEAQD